MFEWVVNDDARIWRPRHTHTHTHTYICQRQPYKHYQRLEKSILNIVDLFSSRIKGQGSTITMEEKPCITCQEPTNLWTGTDCDWCANRMCWNHIQSVTMHDDEGTEVIKHACLQCYSAEPSVCHLVTGIAVPALPAFGGSTPAAVHNTHCNLHDACTDQRYFKPCSWRPRKKKVLCCI